MNHFSDAITLLSQMYFKRSFVKETGNTVFGSIKLYALKQVYEWKDYSSFQLRTMFWNKMRIYPNLL